MPRYCYHCEECGEEFEQSHSITIVLEDCHLCAAQDTLTRIPSLIREAAVHKTAGTKVGDVVKAHIEETRQEVKKDKRKLSQEMVE